MPGTRRRANNPFSRACSKLMTLAERIYADDLGKMTACLAVITTAADTVDRESYDASAYNPFQVLIDELRDNYPELWEGDERTSAAVILSRWIT